MAAKLSTAQLALLKERKGQFVDTYKPGRKLMELGLIDVNATSFGYYRWAINAAGEAFLTALVSSEN